MPREYLPYAIIETQFIFTDHRYLSLAPVAKLLYLTLWCRAFVERRSTLPLTSTHPRAIKRDTGIDHRTFRKYVKILSDEGLTILLDDGRIKIPGIHGKGNISWKDEDKGGKKSSLNDKDKTSDKEKSKPKPTLELEGELEGDIDKAFTLKARKRKGGEEYSEVFISFWSGYPHGETTGSKAQTFRSWKKLLKEKIEVETLFKARDNYAGFVQAKGTEPEFIIRASNFLGRNRRFEEFLDGAYRKPKVGQGELGILKPDMGPEYWEDQRRKDSEANERLRERKQRKG